MHFKKKPDLAHVLGGGCQSFPPLDPGGVYEALHSLLVPQWAKGIFSFGSSSCYWRKESLAEGRGMNGSVHGLQSPHANYGVNTMRLST
jgi:hypothetical protein